MVSYISISHCFLHPWGHPLANIPIWFSCMSMLAPSRRLSPNSSWTFSTLPHLHYYLHTYKPRQDVAGIAHVHNTSLLRHITIFSLCVLEVPVACVVKTSLSLPLAPLRLFLSTTVGDGGDTVYNCDCGWLKAVAGSTYCARTPCAAS